MGNWTNEPTTYSYVWALDGTTVGTDVDYTIVVPDDVGRDATCTVTASNAHGATTAPTSNAVTVADPAGATSEDAGRRKHRRHE
jgi:hypothetical protein